TEINVGIQQHLQKAYNTNKAAFKSQHWVIDPMTGTYNVEKIRRARPENITASEWDKGRAQPLGSTHCSFTPSSWHTLLTENSFGMRTDEEMRRLEATGTYTAHKSTLNSLHKKVDFMMSLFKSDSKYSDMFSHFESGGASGSGGCRDDEEGADHQDEDEDGDGDTYEQSQVARETYPQRQVAGESLELSLGKRPNVVVVDFRSFAKGRTRKRQKEKKLKWWKNDRKTRPEG
nr:hypothetical protein [Tanacetum cinerariifolium]